MFAERKSIPGSSLESSSKTTRWYMLLWIRASAMALSLAWAPCLQWVCLLITGSQLQGPGQESTLTVPGMILVTFILRRYNSELQTSEMFNTAGRTVKSGLVGSAVVSSWTWAATLVRVQPQMPTIRHGMAIQLLTWKDSFNPPAYVTGMVYQGPSGMRPGLLSRFCCLRPSRLS